MATTAEAYGFGARAPYATPRASEHDMKERARLSGLFPRVRNEPMSKQLQVLLKEFEQNAALTGILERRRRLEERMQYELQGREGIDALTRHLTPPPSRRDGRCSDERSNGGANRRSPGYTSACSRRRKRDGRRRRSRRIRRGQEQRQRRSSHAAAGHSERGRARHSCAGPKPEPPRQRKPLSKRVVGTRGDRWH